MKWIRTTERLPTEADADWDGTVVVWGRFISPIPSRMTFNHAFFGEQGWANVWWLGGYRTEKPEPPKEDDE